MADQEDDQGGRRKNKNQKGRQSRQGDAVMDSTFVKRLVFRFGTDVFGDGVYKLVSTPTGRAALQTLSELVSPAVLQLLVTGGNAAVQSPALISGILHALGLGEDSAYIIAETLDEGFDGIRRAIRTEKNGEETVRVVNLNDVDRVIAESREKFKAVRPAPPKTYADAFLALSPDERSTWDAILRRFTPEQSAEFARFRNSLTDPQIFRAALSNTVDRLGEAEPPTALLQFFGRHFDVPKPPAATKVAAFAGELVKNAKNALEKTFRVLPEEQRNATHTARMERLQALSDEMDQD